MTESIASNPEAAPAAQFAYTESNRLDVAGGLLHGPGTATSDSIPAVAPFGAFILNAEAVKVVGADKLDALLSLARGIRVHLRLSAGEFVLPPDVVTGLGRPFLDSLNVAGRLLMAGESPDPDEHRALMIAQVDEALTILADLKEHGHDWSQLSAKTLAAVARCDREYERALGVEDEASSPVPAVPALALGGYLGIAAGAGVDEFHRQRQADRQDELVDLQRKTSERADEELGISREKLKLLQAAEGRAMAAHGLDFQKKELELKAKQREAEEDEAVSRHFSQWPSIIERIKKGDFSDIETGIAEYNTQAGPFNDGFTFRRAQGPAGQILQHVDAEGNVKAEFPMNQTEALRLANLGFTAKLKAISPRWFEKLSKADAEAREKAAEQQAKKDTAQISADAQRYAADTRGKSLVEAARIRANAAGQPKGLTASQERQNEEIDAAREYIDGLDDEEIRHLTSPSTATGRPNDDYDPQLAYAVKLARRRKVGADDFFDQRQGRKPAQSGADVARADIAQRFRADRAMNAYRLGKDTEKGVEVLDASGKLIGFYR